ncbi:MAG: alpha-L-rhamnosidase C-terminal domain-containing protein [Chthoniobacteraceae bacterium]
MLKKTLTENSGAKIPEAIQQAKWIWPEADWWNLYHCFALFRKTFTLSAKPAADTWLYITADQSYRVYINGKYVTSGPARGFQSHWPYDTVEVSSCLKKGKNLVAVRAYNPGTSNFQYLFAGSAGLLAALDIKGSLIVTDETWEARRQYGIRRDTLPASAQLGYPQEHIDLREEDPRWYLPGTPEGTWNPPGSRPTWNVMPWSTLEERGLPQMTECWWKKAQIIGHQQGTSARDFEKAPDVTQLRLKEGFSFSSCEGNVSRIEINPGKPGKFQSYLIDFGKTVFGCPFLSLEGCDGGEVVDTLFVETVQPDLTPDFLANSCSHIAFGGRLICREGTSEHLFYHPYGFRYMVVTLRRVKKPLALKVALQWKGYPLERKGQFHCSDRVLNQIWEACAWTQQCCSLDAYVDTPWREQAQWWGDARVQGWNTFFLSGDDRLFKRGIHSIASQTLPDGLTYGHAPTCGNGCILPDFTLIWVLTLWDHYWQTGSLEMFQRHRAQVAAALTYFEKHTHPECGLVSYDRRYWLFLDWTGICKEGYPALLSLWLFEVLQKLEILYKLTGDEEESARMRNWHTRLGCDIAALITPEGLLADGLTTSMEKLTECSVHTQTLALLTKLPGVNPQILLQKSLVPFSREEFKPEIHPSSYWITYVFQALAEQGYGAEVIAYIRSHWSEMAKHGTTWENFNPMRGEESFSHAWSAHPLYHLMQIIGGIRQTSPSWKTIRWSPVFPVQHAEVTVPTPQGLIRTSWKKNGAEVEICIDLPKGIVAEVVIPGHKSRSVKGKWQITLKSPRPAPASRQNAALNRRR